MPTETDEDTVLLTLTVQKMKNRRRYKDAQIDPDAPEDELVEALRRAKNSIRHEVRVKEGFPTETEFWCRSCGTKNGCIEGACRHAGGKMHGNPPLPQAALQALALIHRWQLRRQARR